MQILVVAPHADDEVLGCGGLIARRVSEGHSVDVVVATIGDVHRDGKLKCSAETRRAELAEAARILGVRQTTVCWEGFENRLDSMPLLEIISRFDGIFGSGVYDQVFIPYPSHHQDHRIVFNACRAALRERGAPHPLGLLAAYEYAYVGWSPESPTAGRYYVDVAAFLDKKRAALEAYRSQVYAYPHPLSVEAMETLARMRGIECGRLAAELFYVLRMVEVA